MMEYFNYLIYFILAHIIMTFAYRGYIYYLYKTYDIQFNQQSAFFSLVRKEIEDNMRAQKNPKAYQGLKKLLVLHIILSMTGKIIVAMIVLVVAMFAISTVK